MKKIFLVLLFGLVFALMAYAVPQYIDYQGMLRNSSGSALTGTYSMTFKIYNASSGGSSVFDSGAQSVSVSNGIYNVRLGPVTSSIFDGNDKWLEVAVGSETMSPRLRINSVAYAIVAGTAEVANALSGSANISTTGAVTAGAFTLNGGKLNVTTGINVAVGVGTIEAGSSSVYVDNTSVTSSSRILVTVGPSSSSNSNGGVRVGNIDSNGFRVWTMTGEAVSNIPFSYLIIN